MAEHNRKLWLFERFHVVSLAEPAELWKQITATAL